ncbi:hypothetical protein IVB30_19710 [Bradyrhizobium sp. 200]|uniref:hypothetical protein n=1 Tax=Bradyrhizobium sp. 200 TaxID=2782665 RepID=UPI001FFFD6CF|nr:hypothetical protein [Bradyrhizobium sp. 200]UPJ53340.1 hypothetical protein IVB30_19710 [Bradyrhizobium sp. 200]
MPEMTGFRSANVKSDEAAREGAPEAIEVTAAMIAAGVYAAREHSLGERLEDLVLKIYLAMALETQ